VASSRGAANGALYRARILLETWESARETQRHPEAYLAAAFLPAVRDQLIQAYGWFLLAVAGIDEVPGGRPPRSTRDLPALEPGKALPPEVREFALLEDEGWVGELLAERDVSPAPRARVPAAVLTSDTALPGPSVVGRWADRLAATMERMDDSLAEC